MEISLQNKINYLSIHAEREKMILEQKLHIKDNIEYSRFKELHDKYAPQISEKDFARYFLDIDYIAYYKLQTGINQTSTILEREFYLDEEFDDIERRVIEEYKLQQGNSINYEMLTYLWDKYGSRFPLKMFAQEIFKLSDRRVDDLKFKRENTAIISMNEPRVSRIQIRMTREKLAKESGLHMGDSISLEKFYQLYNTYYVEGLDEREFALKILGIQIDTFNRFVSGKRPTTIIFSSYPINPNSICNLREEVICTENLRIGTITLDRFWELYEKYSGVLPVEVFVESILDNSFETIKSAKRRKHDISILGNIEIPEEYIEQIRKKVIDDNDLTYNQLMSLEQMRQIYNKVASIDHVCFIMGEKTFICRVLGVPLYNYQQLSSGTTYRSYILSNGEEIDLKLIREKIIRENSLHYDDVIGYDKLHELHQKYAPTVREYLFALQVLDIDQSALDNIRHLKGYKNTHILLDEPLPTQEEIDKIKEQVLKKYRLKRRQVIDYKFFEEIYNNFGGIMPKDMFAERILDISSQSLRKIRNDDTYSTQSLLRTFLTPEQMKEQRKIKEEKQKRNRQETKAKIAEEKELIEKENKVKKILEQGEFGKRETRRIEEFISICKRCYEDGNFPVRSLEILKECIEAIQGGISEVLTYCQICISFREYRKAYVFISNNIENPGIEHEDVEKLRQLQNNIKYAIKKNQAREMIKKGITDCKYIAEELGILEIDVIKLKNGLHFQTQGLPNGESSDPSGR